MWLTEHKRRWGWTSVLLGSALASACAQQMANQPSYAPLEPSSFFADQRSARPLVPGTVPRMGKEEKAAKSARNSFAAEPATPPLTEALLRRGRERYDIYCSVCHGLAGYGDGMVVERGFSRPPSLHTARLRQAPARHFFEVITLGFGAMPSYAVQTTVEDRWAIIAYLRALQLSQHATTAEVPPAVRRTLETGENR